MEPKALIIVPKSKASPEFLALLPTDTQIEVLDDAVYEQFLFGFDQVAKVQADKEPVDLGNFGDLDGDMDFGPIDTEDGC